ncbi:MAG: sulfatase [Verrucomicrobiota bacterium]
MSYRNHAFRFGRQGARFVTLLLSAASLTGEVARSYAESLTRTNQLRPNIIFLLTDDQRWDTLGCMGNSVIRTPEIDALARAGVLFRNTFVTTSVCSPSRASILTGQYARRRGVGDLHNIVTPNAPSATYPSVLRSGGYYTGHIGKWDVGTWEEGFRFGADLFDYWGGDRFHGNYWHERDCPFVTNNGTLAKADICCTCPPDASMPRTGHVRMKDPIHTDLDIVPQKTKQFLAGRDTDKPFYLSISFRAPKDPWGDCPENFAHLYESAVMPIPKTATSADAKLQPKFLRKSMGSEHGMRMVNDSNALAGELRKYYRSISTVDTAVGKLRRLLEVEGLADNTIILFASDNGHFLGEHGFWGKWLPYEGSIRVPFLVFDPRLPAQRRGVKREEMVLNIDWAPTVLALADCSIPGGMQGKDLTPLLRGEHPAWRSDWFYEHTWTGEGRIAPSEAVRSTEWKYVRYTGETPVVEQLFNLKEDPDETANRIADASCATIADKMRQQLKAYRCNLAQ